MGENVSASGIALRAVLGSWAALASAAFTLWAAYVMISAKGFSWVVALWLLWGAFWTLNWALLALKMRAAKASIAAAQEPPGPAAT